MKNLKLFSLILFSLILSIASAQPYTRAQVKTLWEPRVLPSEINIDSTWNAVVFKQDTTSSLYKVKTNSSDNSANYLTSKIIAGSGITSTVSGSTNKIMTLSTVVRDTVVLVSSVELLAANGTTGLVKAILPTRGVASAIIPINISIAYTKVGANFNGVQSLAFFTGGINPSTCAGCFLIASDILDATASQFNYIGTSAAATDVTNLAFGQGINLHFTTPGSKPSAGGGNLIIYLSYRVITSS